MSVAANLLETDDIAPNSIVNTQDIERPPDSVRLIHHHRSYVVSGSCDLPYTRTCSISLITLSQETPLCSVSAPRFMRRYLLLLVSLFLISLSLFPFLLFILAARRRISRPSSRRTAHLPFSERIRCLLTGGSSPYRFPQRYARFGATAPLVRTV